MDEWGYDLRKRKFMWACCKYVVDLFLFFSYILTMNGPWGWGKWDSNKDLWEYGFMKWRLLSVYGCMKCGVVFLVLKFAAFTAVNFEEHGIDHDKEEDKLCTLCFVLVLPPNKLMNGYLAQQDIWFWKLRVYVPMVGWQLICCPPFSYAIHIIYSPKIRASNININSHNSPYTLLDGSKWV